MRIYVEGSEYAKEIAQVIEGRVHDLKSCVRSGCPFCVESLASCLKDGIEVCQVIICPTERIHYRNKVRGEREWINQIVVESTIKIGGKGDGDE